MKTIRIGTLLGTLFIVFTGGCQQQQPKQQFSLPDNLQIGSEINIGPSSLTVTKISQSPESSVRTITAKSADKSLYVTVSRSLQQGSLYDYSQGLAKKWLLRGGQFTLATPAAETPCEAKVPSAQDLALAAVPSQTEPTVSLLTLPPTPIIRVLAYYTPLSRLMASQGGMNGAQVITAEFHTSMAEVNDSLAASGINAQVETAAVLELPGFLETYNPVQDFYTFTDPNGPYRVYTRRMRNIHQADLVTLMINGSPGGGGSGACGVGWINTMLGSMDPTNPTQIRQASALGFNVVRLGCLINNTNHTLAHEIGHNAGLHHDHQTAQGDFNPDAGAYPYAYGFMEWVGTQLIGDLMSYAGSRAPLYSNPSLSWQGVTIGVPDYADSSRAFNQTAPIVSMFR